MYKSDDEQALGDSGGKGLPFNSQWDIQQN